MSYRITNLRLGTLKLPNGVKIKRGRSARVPLSSLANIKIQRYINTGKISVTQETPPPLPPAPVPPAPVTVPPPAPPAPPVDTVAEAPTTPTIKSRRGRRKKTVKAEKKE
tara:strand:- start:912 stop:1241 length:330 start_codon:yes stop_codon:yes gene_type:complete